MIHSQGMLLNDTYVYMDHLLALNSCISPEPRSVKILSLEVYSPLKLHQWTQDLQTHPDKDFSLYILQGIKSGFRIGFNRAQPLRPATSNLCSSNPSVIFEYLEREVSLTRMWKYPRHCSPPGIHISPLGVIPKKNKPGKWRLIVDLSSPAGFSINDGISHEFSSMKYTSLDHLTYLVNSVGRGALLVKADIKEAYRMIPIHPHDQHLLGIKWNDSYYVDRMLPFGLRSAPKIFSAVADGLQWILTQRGISNLLHYLDDFIFVAPSVEQAVSHKFTLISSFQHLGVPLEPSKLEGPSTCLTFLGIEVDTEALMLRLPKQKLLRLKQELSHCLLRKSITKRELQSLTGSLQFATKVIRPGRSFLRQLYAMQAIGSHPAHHIRLNSAARADIVWWHLFAEDWNGISILWDSSTLRPEFNVFSDASGSWGCGAYWGLQWFHFQWPDHLYSLPIVVKELIPVVVAAAVFGSKWKGHLIQFLVDNMAVVHILNSTYSKDSHLMHLIRILVFLAARFDFWFVAKHIEGKENSLADDLSRDNLVHFFSQVPQAEHQQPPHIPAPLLDLLGSTHHIWTSTDWIRLFGDTMKQVCHHPHIRPTRQLNINI